MNRIHELDALRAAAMLLVVVVHALCFLMPFSDFWPGKHVFAEETQPLYNPYVYVFSALAGFLMPLFFMLSGYFTAMQWRRRGLAQMVMARAKHVGLPLLLAMVTVIPLTHWVFTGGENNSITWPEHFYHLWFLWYLLLIVGAFGLAAKLGLRFRHRLWWLLVPAPVVPQYFMRQIVGADVPGGFLPELSIFAYYLVFFLAGVLLHQRSVPVRRWWSSGLPIVLPLLALALVFLYPDRIGFVDPERAWAPVGAALFQVAYTWMACFGMMGLFRRIASRERSWVRYVSDASYWIYVMHLPLVVWAQRLAAESSFNPHLAFVSICVAVPGLLLAVYAWGVRHTWVGTLLNGMRIRVRPVLSDG
ncbi:MAG: acyltransferase [Candidatus Aminicenantes bacterium]|nr:acyltransferase [Candidatus Aminicenantes bacterium]